MTNKKNIGSLSRRFIILQGVPASGKSTWARNFINETPDPSKWVIINRDSIRNMRGDYWIPEQEKFITRVIEDIVQTAMDFGYNIISDDTNLNPKVLEIWHYMVSRQNRIYDSNYVIEYKFFIIRIG